MVSNRNGNAKTYREQNIIIKKGKKPPLPTSARGMKSYALKKTIVEQDPLTNKWKDKDHTLAAFVREGSTDNNEQ